MPDREGSVMLMHMRRFSSADNHDTDTDTDTDTDNKNCS